MHIETPIIQVKDLTVVYQSEPVIWDLDFMAPQGVLLAIVGPNGGGKSTLLRSFINLIQPVTGNILFFGQPYTAVKQRIAYIPQRTSVDWTFPISVFETVLMGRYGKLSFWQRPSCHDTDIALDALEQVGMQEYAHRHISELSGGQQQRVFLARALAQQADIYLMDEPFVGIDMTTEQTIIKVLKKLRKQNKTVIIVHHDLLTLQKYFDWAFFMNKKHIALGPIKEVLTAQTIKKTFAGKHPLLQFNMLEEL